MKNTIKIGDVKNFTEGSPLEGDFNVARRCIAIENGKAIMQHTEDPRDMKYVNLGLLQMMALGIIDNRI